MPDRNPRLGWQEALEIAGSPAAEKRQE